MSETYDRRGINAKLRILMNARQLYLTLDDAMLRKMFESEPADEEAGLGRGLDQPEPEKQRANEMIQQVGNVTEREIDNSDKVAYAEEHLRDVQPDALAQTAREATEREAGHSNSNSDNQQDPQEVQRETQGPAGDDLDGDYDHDAGTDIEGREQRRVTTSSAPENQGAVVAEMQNMHSRTKKRKRSDLGRNHDPDSSSNVNAPENRRKIPFSVRDRSRRDDDTMWESHDGSESVRQSSLGASQSKPIYEGVDTSGDYPNTELTTDAIRSRESAVLNNFALETTGAGIPGLRKPTYEEVERNGDNLHHESTSEAIQSIESVGLYHAPEDTRTINARRDRSEPRYVEHFSAPDLPQAEYLGTGNMGDESRDRRVQNFSEEVRRGTTTEHERPSAGAESSGVVMTPASQNIGSPRARLGSTRSHISGSRAARSLCDKIIEADGVKHKKLTVLEEDSLKLAQEQLENAELEQSDPETRIKRLWELRSRAAALSESSLMFERLTLFMMYCDHKVNEKSTDGMKILDTRLKPATVIRRAASYHRLVVYLSLGALIDLNVDWKRYDTVANVEVRSTDSIGWRESRMRHLNT